MNRISRFPGGLNYRGWCIYRSRSKRARWFVRLDNDSLQYFKTIRQWIQSLPTQ